MINCNEYCISALLQADTCYTVPSNNVLGGFFVFTREQIKFSIRHTFKMKNHLKHKLEFGNVIM